MRTASDKRWAFVGHVIFIFMTLAALIPFLLLITASFTDENTAVRNGYSFFPEQWSLDAYRYIANQWAVIGRGYLTSLLVTATGTVGGVTLSAMLAYTLSRRDLPGRAIISFFITFTMLFNGGLTASYITYTQIFHIKDTIFGLLLPNLLLNAYSVFMLRNYFEMSIPPALMEAAQIDGASEVRTFRSIVVPLALPMLATVGLTTALMYWNDWQNGVYYLSTTSPLQSIQTILMKMNENIKYLQQNNIAIDSSMSIPSTTVRMAIAVVGILPILCLYPIFQKWFVRGMVSGAVKE